LGRDFRQEKEEAVMVAMGFAKGEARPCRHPARPGDPVRHGFSANRCHLWNTGGDDSGDNSTRRANQRFAVKLLVKKYSGFQNTQISCISQSSCPPEGRLEIVTDAGQDAMDAEGAEDVGA
jgi:hypothetical protein